MLPYQFETNWTVPQGFHENLTELCHLKILRLWLGGDIQVYYRCTIGPSHFPAGKLINAYADVNTDNVIVNIIGSHLQVAFSIKYNFNKWIVKHEQHVLNKY